MKKPCILFTENTNAILGIFESEKLICEFIELLTSEEVDNVYYIETELITFDSFDDEVTKKLRRKLKRKLKRE